MTIRFRVLVEQDEDGMFVVECPNLPGCVSQGKTRAEALANIREAIELYLEDTHTDRMKSEKPVIVREIAL